MPLHEMPQGMRRCQNCRTFGYCRGLDLYASSVMSSCSWWCEREDVRLCRADSLIARLEDMLNKSATVAQVKDGA